MDIEKETVIDFIMIRDISSIALIAAELEIGEDEVRGIITGLLREGRLEGQFSNDWQRFYRANI
ncbi:MAG: hypothetical protein P1Q69_12100 [Candidatus Thorarchaeota archaeon]|nr:hypothetical protein [Candidatus Thorarchaeota archaeon]